MRENTGQLKSHIDRQVQWQRLKKRRNEYARCRSWKSLPLGKISSIGL